MGTTQFMAVPYTLNDNIVLGIDDPQAKLDILGGDWNLDAGNPGDLRIGNSTNNFRIGIAIGGGGAGITRMYTNSNALILGVNDTPTFILEQDRSIVAPYLTNTLINEAGNKALVTKEYVDANSNTNTAAANFFTNTHITGYSSGIEYQLIFDSTKYNFGGGA